MTAPVTTSPADGETQTLITVTLKDQFGNAVSGRAVTLTGLSEYQRPDPSLSHLGARLPGTTDTNGVAEFEVDDTIAETVTFTATDTTDNLVLAETVAITYTPGAATPSAARFDCHGRSCQSCRRTGRHHRPSPSH